MQALFNSRSFLSASAIIMSSLIFSCTNNDAFRNEVTTFLEDYNKKYKDLMTASSEAQWNANVKIVEGDSTNEVAVRKTGETLAQFTGSKEVVEKVKAYLEKKDKLDPLQKRQLERILYMAAGNHESAGALVKDRIKAEAEQVEKLFGYKFMLNNKQVSTNDLDAILKDENDLAKRQKAWEASKEVGKGLKEGLVKLRNYRNAIVKPLGYSDFFSYQVSDYGMTKEDMIQLLDKVYAEIYPLYRELHTYARYELATKYGVKEIPDYLPAHWLPNRWAQDWNEIVSVKGMNLDSALKTKTAEWIVKEGEAFYTSLGFDHLPQTFWERSSLYPLAAGISYTKNNHASAWHIDLDKDVRSLMSVVPNTEWYETVHHELGHIYYYMSYSRAEIPPVLREGANRAYHEALGSLMGLAAMQEYFIAEKKILPEGVKTDQMQSLLKSAMNYITFLPFSAGTMSHFEHELYSQNLPADQFNKRWWELVKQYQGVVPPSERGEDYCDAATKTHINDDPAQYYDYALSYVLLFQLNDHITTKILKGQGPTYNNYFGSLETGKFIKDIMEPGASVDWRQILKEKTGEDLSARAMLDYYKPLIEYLKKINSGRKYTLPEKPAV